MFNHLLLLLLFIVVLQLSFFVAHSLSLIDEIKWFLATTYIESSKR